jgi:hypothetical protein
VKVNGSWLATRGREREGERVNLGCMLVIEFVQSMAGRDTHFLVSAWRIVACLSCVSLIPR